MIAAGTGHGALVGVAVALILASTAAGWLLRTLLLKLLRERHPQEFARLGEPSSRQLASLMPRNNEVQVQFWKFLWGKAVFLTGDRWVSGLAVAARAADVALCAGIALLFWSAGR